MNRLAELATRWLPVLAVVGYLAWVTPQLTRPFIYDDANFAFAARDVADTGLPFGNQGWMSERGDFSQREQWALWHPPLYVYLLGGIARVFGAGEVPLRLPAVLAGLATAVLVYRLAGEVTEGPLHQKRLAGSLAVALTLVAPLLVQSTLILDIDFALLVPLTLLFLLLYLRWESAERWPWLALLFAVLLWAKMTNPLPLLGAVFAWQVLRGHLRRAVVQALVIGGGGAALFGLTWLAVGTALRMPLDMPFGVNLVQWQDSSEVARRAFAGPEAFLEALRPVVTWIGVGLTVAGLAGGALRAGQLAERWQPTGIDLLLGLAVVLVLGYVNKTAGWLPKYQVVLVPLFACAAAPPIARALLASGRAWLGLGLATLGAFGVARWLIRDTWALERTWTLSPESGFALLVVFFVATLVGSGRNGRVALLAPLPALAGLALGWGIATSTIQARAPYSTTYWYGTRGIERAAEWVDRHVAADETYVAAKEVAYRATPQRYVDQETVTYFLDHGRPFDGAWEGRPVRAVVAWTREPYVGTLLARRLPEIGFVETARFDDYVVYEPVGLSSPRANGSAN